MSTAAKRILLVDDDPVVLRGYGQRLRAEGFDVTTAADGYEALTLVTQRSFDLVLLDLRIPYRNGVEVLRALRARRESSRTPVHLLVQPGDADIVDRAMREGADGLFEKARISPRDLAIEVEAILGGPRRARATAISVIGDPSASVPAAVDEIARRFRKDSSATARAAARASVATASAAGAAARTTSLGTDAGGSATASTFPAVMPAPRGTRPVLPPIPHGADASAAGSAGSDSAAGASAAAGTAAPGSAGTTSRGSSASAWAARRVTLTGLPPAGAAPPGPPFDVVLNRMVGQPAHLAAALGLSPDYACPFCSGPLVLRLEVDADVEFGVTGRFCCPRCVV